MQAFEKLSHRGQVARLKRLALCALHEYEVAPTRMSLLSHEENTTLRVEDAGGGQYVLRVHRTVGSPWHPVRDVEAVRSEMQWLAALRRDTGLGVPEPVHTKNGDLLTVATADGVPEPRVCVLFRWLGGRFHRESLTPLMLEKVGTFMARLHDHAATFAVPEGFTRHIQDNMSDEIRTGILAMLSEVRPAEDVGVVEEATGRIQGVMDRLGTGPGVFGLIHADLHQDNYLFHRGEVRAIDFDDCGWGHHLYDFAATLFAIKGRPQYLALREALLRGYRSVRDLDPEHEALIDSFIAMRRLHIMMWYVEQREHPAFRDEWVEEVDWHTGKFREFLQAQPA